MRKIFTAFLSLALCSTVNAQSIKTLSVGLGTPGIDEPQFIGLGISADGKYVCGSLEMGAGYFVADLENNFIQYDVTEDEEGAELRHVDNNGLAIGYNGPGVTYSIDGVETVLENPSDEYKYVLGEDLTNDGSVMVGSLVGTGFVTYAAYSKDGGEWTMLPQVDGELLEEIGVDGGSAKYVSGDGKVILGFVGSFGPAVLWVMNDEGEYEVDPLFSKYVILTEEEEAAGEKVLYNLSAANLSNNGKYAALTGVIMVEDGFMTVPAIYDIEARELTIYSEPQEIDEYGIGLTPSAIADDGTMIGIIGTQPLFGCAGSFIWKAGEDRAKSFSDAFPFYAEKFGFADSIGYCVPTGISADGRYILGYGFYCDDFFDEDAIAYYSTYIIDNSTSGIEVPAVIEGQAVPEAIYTIDGKLTDRMTKGINIVRMSDGSARKVINK